MLLYLDPDESRGNQMSNRDNVIVYVWNFNKLIVEHERELVGCKMVLIVQYFIYMLKILL